MEDTANPAINQGEGIGQPYDQVVCPYNDAHIIQRYKLTTHLTKCAAQHKNSHTKQCPYDNKHIVPEVTFNHHVKTCPQRKMLDHAKYSIDPACERAAVDLRAPTVDADEDWENDQFNSYNPAEQASRQPNLIRKIQGAVPSDRRAFRMEQRKNYRQNN